MSEIKIQKWVGGAEFHLTQVPQPSVVEGERLVEMHVAAVCGSDRHTVLGRRSGACPSILGHEGVGVIVEGPGRGKRVVFSVTSVCGECDFCTRGLSAKCVNVLKVGHESFEESWPLSGTYASHIVLPTGVSVVEVPASIPDGAAAIAGCSVATVMATLEAAGTLDGKTVFINGLGMLGLVAVAAAFDRGAASVEVFDPSAERMNQAIALGAHAKNAEQKVDIALEYSGAAAGVTSVIRSLDIGGTAVLAGSVAPAGNIDIDPEWMVRGWRTVTGVHNYEPHHLQEAVDFLEKATLPWDELLSGPISLEELGTEFAHPHDGLRTLVTMN